MFKGDHTLCGRFLLSCRAGVWVQQRTLLGVVLLLWVFAPGTHAAITPISVSVSGSPYTQNFDSLANSGGNNTIMPAEWGFLETGNPGQANLKYTASDGSLTAGDTYSFGSPGSTDRALGTLQSSRVLSRIGVGFVNAGATPITSLIISFSGEQWRLGGVGAQDKLSFQYSLNASDLGDAWTWNSYAPGDFNSLVTSGSVGALDGNANSATVSYTVSGISVAPGSSFWLRWVDEPGVGGENGLAIDDFSMTVIPEPEIWGIGTVVFLGLVALLRRLQIRLARKRRYCQQFVPDELTSVIPPRRQIQSSLATQILR